MAHNDVISILLPIFSEFAHTKEYVHAEIIRKHGRFPATATWDSIQTVYTASTEFVCDATMHLLTLANSFNGDNWPSLDTALGLTLETVSDSALTINNLLAMHLLHGIQVAGKNNHVWAAAHLDLIKMKPKNWHIGADNIPDRLQTILHVARETVKILDHDVDYKPAARLSDFFCPASRRQLSAKNARIALAVFSTASPTTAQSLNGVRNSMLFAANPATKPYSVMLMSSLTLTRLPISGWRLLLILLRTTQQQPVLNAFKRSSQHASPPVLSILVPILKTTLNIASVILWTPIPSY